MKKLFFTIVAIVFCISITVGQNIQTFEGETTARVYKNINPHCSLPLSNRLTISIDFF